MKGIPPVERPWLQTELFGILDRAEPSVALWSRGELLAYGGASAMRALALAYADWTSCGLPGLAGFALQVIRIGSALMGNGRVWTEPRGGTALVWRLFPGAEDWHACCAMHLDRCGALAASGSPYCRFTGESGSCPINLPILCTSEKRAPACFAGVGPAWPAYGKFESSPL